MKVLLINSNREQVPWPALPVGLCTVASATARAGHDVSVLDLAFVKEPAKATLLRVRQEQPEVVGVTIRNIDNCNFELPHFYLTQIRDEVVSSVRRAAPDAVIAIGGAAVNVSPGDVLRYLEADLAVVGEGEEAFPALLSALSARCGASSATHRGIERLPGVLLPGGGSSAPLAVLDTGRKLRGEPLAGRAVVHDLGSSARSEAFRWVDVKRYTARGAPYAVQTKRGCALKCSYCVYNNIEGHAYRLREAREVVDEIEQAVRGHGVRAIDFVDSTFNLPLYHARALCEALAERKLDVSYSTMGLNPAAVTPELAQSLKAAGFKSVMCTPESASETTLRTLHKGFQRHAVVRAAKALRDVGMTTYWFFMLGAPEETLETVRETLAFCEEHIRQSDMVLFSTGIRVYAGTPLERTCKDMGWFAEDDPLFEPSWFLSPALDLNELYALLVKAAEAHPNWMTNAETVMSPAMASMMRSAFKLLGWKGQFWTHLPRLFTLVGKLGIRQKGLQLHAETVRRITDVAHHG
jgi:tRNA A37 methylthiotransferase MiaB